MVGPCNSDTNKQQPTVHLAPPMCPALLWSDSQLGPLKNQVPTSKAAGQPSVPFQLFSLLDLPLLDLQVGKQLAHGIAKQLLVL